jgi:hypothetical protein
MPVMSILIVCVLKSTNVLCIGPAVRLGRDKGAVQCSLSYKACCNMYQPDPGRFLAM